MMQSKEQSIEAIPFIQLIPKKGFRVTTHAELFLASLEELKFGVLCVVGKYRTGKSYLLNKLLQHSPIESKSYAGFQVAPTVNPCTKGLWLLKHIFYFSKADGKISYNKPKKGDALPVLVVDTEGIGAFNEEDNHDSKIFLLGMLLSSLLVYNSVGPIDEASLENLALIVNLSKTLRIKDGEGAVSEEEFASYFPTLIWVLRDFMLKLEDKDGNEITSKQYLENALKEQRGTSELIDAKNRIRKVLRHFFQERDCCTLVRPVEKEKHLQQLDSLKDIDLRPQFLEQLEAFRSKLTRKMRFKKQANRFLSGPMLLEMANVYTKSINSDALPVIENAWTSVCRTECERLNTELKQEFSSDVLKQIKFPLEKEKLKKVLDSLIEDKKGKFAINSLGDEQTIYEKRLSQELRQQALRVLKKNDVLIGDQLEDDMKRRYSPIEEGVRFKSIQTFDQYKAKIAEFQKHFSEMEDDSMQLRLQTFLNQHSMKDLEELLRSALYLKDQEIKLLRGKLKNIEEELMRKRNELSQAQTNAHHEADQAQKVKIELQTKLKLAQEKLKLSEDKLSHAQTKLTKQVEIKDSQEAIKLKLRLETIQEANKGLKKELEDWKKKGERASSETNQLKLEVERKKAEKEQQKGKLEIELERWKERADQLTQDLKSAKMQLATDNSQFTEMRLLLKSTQNELKNLRGSSASAQETSELRIEKNFLEQQSQYLREELRENKKLYQNLVSALQLQGGHEGLLRSLKAGPPLHVLLQAVEEKEDLREELEGLKKKFGKMQDLIGSLNCVECKGCKRMFKFSLFKAHLQICQKVGQISKNKGAQRAESTLDIEISKIERNRDIFFKVGLGGYYWEVKRSVLELEQLVDRVAPHLKDGMKLDGLRVSGKMEQLNIVRELLEKLRKSGVLSKEKKAIREFIKLEQNLGGALRKAVSSSQAKSAEERTVEFVSFFNK